MKRKISVISIISYCCISILSIACLLPFWLMISASLTDQDALMIYGYNIIPKKFSLAAYKAILTFPETILKAYGVSIFVTVVGVVISLFLTSMAAYVLQRKDYPYRNKIAFFIYFTTLFGGGLVPWYIMIVKYLHMKDSIWVLIIPSLVSPFNILLMRNFMNSIPHSLTESAKLDGAGDFVIYLKVIMPLAKAGLATIGLFVALMYWNDWFLGSLFIDDKNKIPLQLLLYNILTRSQAISSGMARTSTLVTIPAETIKMATAVIATGPIILVYPFVQRYFVKGLTIGAVKG